jgi:hypothetical protein
MKCSRCGHEAIDYPGSYSCAMCGTTLTSDNTSASFGRTAVPWESPSAGERPLHALVATLQNSFFKPDRFFSATSAGPSTIVPALLYGLVIGSIGTLAASLWETVLPFSPLSLISGSGIIDNYKTSSSPASLVATPLVLVMQLFFTAFFVHAMLFITKSRKKKFAATFKIICYAEGAMLLQVVPLVGTFLSFAGWLYLVINGIHASHEISRKRAVAAILLPFLFFAALAVALFFISLIALALVGASHQDIFSIFKNR